MVDKRNTLLAPSDEILAGDELAYSEVCELQQGMLGMLAIADRRGSSILKNIAQKDLETIRELNPAASGLLAGALSDEVRLDLE